MLIFRYRAAHATGRIEGGTLSASSRESAAQILKDRGLLPFAVVQQRQRFAAKTRIAAADLGLALRVLADLLESGMPMNRALGALQALVSQRLQAAMPAIAGAVREGQGLGDALEGAPIAIPPIVIGVVRAGEGGSGLPTAVRRAAEIMEEYAATRSAILGALAYPAILCLAGAASVGVLVGLVLPRFAGILGDLGQALPPTTAAVLKAGELARRGFVPALLIGTALVSIWHTWVRTEHGRRQWHEALLAFPVAGSVRFAAATARACAALSALLENGVPIARALGDSGRATGDAALTPRFAAAKQALGRGTPLSVALGQTGAVTPTAIQLIRAGEQSGRLAGMIGHASRLERTRATRLTRTAVQLVEPLLIVLFGGVVALVAGALLQAVYSIRPGT